MPLADRIGLSNWRHVVKLDPDKPMSPPMIKRIAASGTDAVLIGGTQRITRAKVLRLLWHLRQSPVPVVVEMSDEACALPGADAYFVPIVLNTDQHEWFIARHIQGLRRLGALVPWQKVLVEGYIVGHRESAVARRVKARAPLEKTELRALVQYAAGLLHLPVVYLEYSGQLADISLIAAAAATLRRIQASAGEFSRLFYGGGIAGYAAAHNMLQQVDTIVVGNALYKSKALQTLEATLAAVKTAGPAAHG